MKLKKYLLTTAVVVVCSCSMATADGKGSIVFGQDVLEEQKQIMMEYFNIKNDSNYTQSKGSKENTIHYLSEWLTEEQLCESENTSVFIESNKDNGIKIKSANINWLSTPILANCLLTAGIDDVNIIVAAPYEVDGLDGFTNCLLGYETMTGKKLDENKKILAGEELMIITDLSDNFGRDKSTAFSLELKDIILKTSTKERSQIFDIVNNEALKWDIMLTNRQTQDLTNLYDNISKQDYNYKEIKQTLKMLEDTVSEKLEYLGEYNKNRGILENINHTIHKLGKQVLNTFTVDRFYTSTNNKALDIAMYECTNGCEDSIDGLTQRLVKWAKSLFAEETKEKSNIKIATNGGNNGIKIK